MKTIIIFTIAMLNMSMICFAQTRTVLVDGKTYLLHTVEKGEGAMAVARRYNITMSELAEANPVDLNKLYRNQVLRIPIPDTAKFAETPSATAPPKRDTGSIAAVHANAQESVATRKPTQIHTVQAGETLNKIAQRYSVTVSELQKWNNLSGNKISVGQQLKINPFINSTPHIHWNKPSAPQPAIIPLPVEQIIQEYVQVKWIEGDKVEFSKIVSGKVILIEPIYDEGNSLLAKDVIVNTALPAGTIAIGKSLSHRIGSDVSGLKVSIKYTE